VAGPTSIHNIIINCACSVILANAGIQKFIDWIPGHARNDDKEDESFLMAVYL